VYPCHLYVAVDAVFLCWQHGVLCGEVPPLNARSATAHVAGSLSHATCRIDSQQNKIISRLPQLLSTLSLAMASGNADVLIDSASVVMCKMLLKHGACCHGPANEVE
jgi:hypothetical protein